MTQGTLRWIQNPETKKYRPRLSWIERGAPRNEWVKLAHVSADLKPPAAAAVEFEMEGGEPAGVRLPGQEFRPRTTPAKAPKPPAQATSPQAAAAPTATRPHHIRFHHAYNFVPALPRAGYQGSLADAPPIGHGRFEEDRFTGSLRVRITTVTPLLLPDAALAETTADRHLILPPRLGSDDRPYLPPTSLKGALRAAYEAVTNSRLGVFRGHASRLAYRTEARVQGFRPAIVDCREDGSLFFIVCGQLWYNGPAKLPRYSTSSHAVDRGASAVGLRCEDTGELPDHGQRVWFQVNAKGVVIRLLGDSATEPGDDWIDGLCYVTGPNVNSKRYERVFPIWPALDRYLPAGEAPALWRDLILDYKQQHRRDLELRREQGHQPWEYLGDEPGQTAWSRFIWEEGSEELRRGSMCYVKLSDDQTTVEAVMPVSIPRVLHRSPPERLLPPSLRPATKLRELSPADRVFGWVNAAGSSAWRGQLRIGAVACLSDAAIEPFEPPLPLAILSAPKPQQARFYVASNNLGEKLDDGLRVAQIGYQDGLGLRGRKVYPHHAGLPTGYWDNPAEDRTGRALQEYRRPTAAGAEQRDDQNRSIRGWVRPGTAFETTLHVTNLDAVELGALLYLLTLPEGAYHRLGGGKPLGFGSVRLDLAECDLRDGAAWRADYAAAGETQRGRRVRDRDGVDELVDEFTEALEAAEGDTFLLDVFEQAATGFDDGLPTHYPRLTSTMPAEGELFRWFVANESGDGRKLALPELLDDPGLFLDPTGD